MPKSAHSKVLRSSEKPRKKFAKSTIRKKVRDYCTGDPKTEKEFDVKFEDALSAFSDDELTTEKKEELLNCIFDYSWKSEDGETIIDLRGAWHLAQMCQSEWSSSLRASVLNNGKIAIRGLIELNPQILAEIATEVGAVNLFNMSF